VHVSDEVTLPGVQFPLSGSNVQKLVHEMGKPYGKKGQSWILIYEKVRQQVVCAGIAGARI
jgi:hypothetical protein